MHILVATDFSDSAEAALGVAAQYARALHASIDLMHVAPTAGIDATRALKDVAPKLGRDIPVTFACGTGDPADEILRYAASHSIDVIVVGTHGRTGMSRLLLGSVAERVIRGAACPVLVVPGVPVSSREEPRTPSGVAVNDTGVAAAMRERPCLACATPTRDLICEPCRTRIRAEAVESTQREELPDER